MVYVASDIHGDYPKFISMLEKIDFKSVDTMYFLGDAIDRGKKGISILLYIMNTENIKMVKGNHEYLLEQVLTADGSFVSKSSVMFKKWIEANGKGTYHDLKYFNKAETRVKIRDFISKLPLFYDNIDVKGTIYYLVHGKPMLASKEDYIKACKALESTLSFEEFNALPSYEDYILCGRVKTNDVFFKDKVVIFGHTPTDEYQNGVPYEIWHGKNMIGIDCGCGKKDTNERFACLCLDTMEEFYV